ncbi:MAG: fluoride efflux transporter CrcB [Bacteroidota bacterium]
MKSILWVALGGAIGSLLRYAVALWLKPEPSLAFPIHTLLVNVLGCLVIGFVFSFLLTVPNEQYYRLFIITGILGGFTTFSSFGLESFYLFQNNEFLKAGSYILLSNMLGLAAVWAGYSVHKLIV